MASTACTTKEQRRLRKERNTVQSYVCDSCGSIFYSTSKKTDGWDYRCTDCKKVDDVKDKMTVGKMKKVLKVFESQDSEVEELLQFLTNKMEEGEGNQFLRADSVPWRDVEKEVISESGKYREVINWFLRQRYCVSIRF